VRLSSNKTTGKSWYRTWFNTSYYHLLYRNRDEQEAQVFISNLVKYLDPRNSAHFLDLACGKGRHSLTIHEKGFEVTGADLSEENIASAKKYQSEKLHFIQHDMRVPIGEDIFDYILNLFTSFGYFKSIDENEQVIKAISQALKPKGKVVLDFMNVETVIRGLVPTEKKIIEGVAFNIQRRFECGSIVKRIEVIDEGKRMVFKEEVKAITKEQFFGMFHRNGLEIIDVFGNYQLDQFHPDRSPRLILIGKKR
jgi:SAM-dependent methyltransferase